MLWELVKEASYCFRKTHSQLSHASMSAQKKPARRLTASRSHKSMPMTKITRREFSRRAALAAAVPLAAKCPAFPQEAPKPQSTPTPSPGRAQELQKKAEADREEMAAALRAKPLPYDLEPAFVFAARPREKKRPASKEAKR